MIINKSIENREEAIKLIKERSDYFSIYIGFKHCNAASKHSKESLTYTSWHGMKQRCLNSNYDGYKNYGGRGILICERWMVFENFLVDMGKRPSKKYSLDRIDNDGNYELLNCRWLTSKEQIRNSRSAKLSLKDVEKIRELLTRGGIKQYEIAEMFNVSKGNISAIKCGKSWR